MTLELFCEAFLRNSIFMITTTCTCYCKKVKRGEKLDSKICSSWMKKVSRYGNSLGGFFPSNYWRCTFRYLNGDQGALSRQVRNVKGTFFTMVISVKPWPTLCFIRCEIVWARRKITHSQSINQWMGCVFKCVIKSTVYAIVSCGLILSYLVYFVFQSF